MVSFNVKLKIAIVKLLQIYSILILQNSLSEHDLDQFINVCDINNRYYFTFIEIYFALNIYTIAIEEHAIKQIFTAPSLKRSRSWEESYVLFTHIFTTHNVTHWSLKSWEICRFNRVHIIFKLLSPTKTKKLVLHVKKLEDFSSSLRAIYLRSTDFCHIECSIRNIRMILGLLINTREVLYSHHLLQAHFPAYNPLLLSFEWISGFCSSKCMKFLKYQVKIHNVLIQLLPNHWSENFCCNSLYTLQCLLFDPEVLCGYEVHCFLLFVIANPTFEAFACHINTDEAVLIYYMVLF